MQFQCKALSNLFYCLKSQDAKDKVISYLIQHGAKVDVKDTDGLTPLHFAARRGNDVAVKAFVGCPDSNSDVSRL